MRHLFSGLVLSAALFSAAQASGINIGVSISGEIQPGVYGRVEIGNNPPPILYPQPVIIVKQTSRRVPEPVYLHVPPGHAKNWRKYCGRYNACSRPVYFVKSAEYAPDYRRDDRNYRDEQRSDERGPGNAGKHKGH